jgi:putative acetyltransferase
MEIKEDDLKGAEIRHLLQTHFDLMRDQSPPESCHVLPLDELRKPEIKFFSAWDKNQLVGCGAIKDLGDGDCEIKSMHVYKHLRGQGFSRQILVHLIDYAKAHNFKKMWLETGSFDKFIAARNLYASFGFVECAPFGEYVYDPLSVFMSKKI